MSSLHFYKIYRWIYYLKKHYYIYNINEYSELFYKNLSIKFMAIK